MLEELNGVNRGMEIASKTRSDKESEELHHLKVQIARLENTLNMEVKRRAETNKAIQGMFEGHIATVQDKLGCGLVERLDKLAEAVDVLNDRVSVVEEVFHTERARYVRDMEDKSALVAKDITALKSAFQQEWRERKDRETLVVAKLRDLDERAAERLVKDQKV